MKYFSKIISVLCIFLSYTDVTLAENLVKKVDECRKTELYRSLNSRDVVIFVEEFDLKTGLIIKQQLLKGTGKVPKNITDIIALMDRQHFKNNQYIYAYDIPNSKRTSGGTSLLMVHNNKVESMKYTIAIETLIKAFKVNAKPIKQNQRTRCCVRLSTVNSVFMLFGLRV